MLINDNYPACTNTSGNRSVGKRWTIPITDLSVFHDWSFDSNSNHGIALVSENDNDRAGWKRFTSRDYDPSGGAYAPYLDLTWEYSSPPQVRAVYPPHGSSSPTLTPELLVDAVDPDRYPSAMTYQFQVFDPASATPTVAIADSGMTSSRSFVVPAGKLQWSKSYLWMAVVSDGANVSTSQINMLTPAVPQAPITSSLSQNADKGFAPNVGNYTTSAVDAQVPTAGPALAISRSYNSRDPRTGAAFGTGWSSILDAKAVELTDPQPAPASPVLRAVTVTYPTGQDVTFGRNADGSFTPPSGRFSTLRAVAGGYELVDKEGTQYSFTVVRSGGGFGLTAITDAQGRRLSLTYTAGKVTTMSGASGRNLNLVWSADRVAEVANEAGDKWTYTYTGGTLTKVCPPTSATSPAITSNCRPNSSATFVHRVMQCLN